MKKAVVLFALITLVLTATAQADDWPNSLGLYFDTEGTQNDGPNPGGITPLYLILANPTAASIAAFEVGLRITAGAGIQEVEYPTDAQNFEDLPHFVVGYGTPVPASPVTILATLHVFTIADTIVEIKAGPVQFESIYLRAAYVDGENLANIIPVDFSTNADGQFIDNYGWLTIPLCVIGGDAPIAAEDATWSSVKTLYR